MISTPITGVDSILATYGMFGWIFTLYRVFTSMVIATIAGILTNLFDKEMSVKEEEQISRPLFWGLVIGALIIVAIPQNLSDILVEYSWLSYLIVIIIAVPMYVCATASLPIAAALMLSGVSAGAAFVFLSAGPATNTVTIGVVKNMLGTRSSYIYLGTIIVGSILFGLGLDYVFTISDINPQSLIHMDKDAGYISMMSSVFLWGFVGYFILKPYFKKEQANSCSN